MRGIDRYILNNYHHFPMQFKSMYSIDYNILAEELCRTINILMLNLNDSLPNESISEGVIPELILINSSERKSKYISTEKRDYIILDLRQILEYAFGSKIANSINDDVETIVSISDGCDKNDINIIMSIFSYKSIQNILKARICTGYNLADLCFSNGYVDAAVKTLCSIKMIRGDLYEKNVQNFVIPRELLYESKIIGGFIYLHEFTHYFIRRTEKSIFKINEFNELINLIRLRYENGILSKEWNKYAKQYSSNNHIINHKIYNLFIDLKINERYPKLFEELKRNALSWKELSFDLEDWDLYAEELICDIVSINTIIDSGQDNYYLIPTIIRSLLVQETFSLQNNLLMYITGKQKKISSLNIKRVQLLFSALGVDYQEHNKQNWKPIINCLEYRKNHFWDLLEDIWNSIEVIHENFYLTAIQDFCNSILSDDILHKNINCAYFLHDTTKNFVFTDDYCGEKYTEKSKITNVDAILLQKNIAEEYGKFVNYVFR